MSEVIVRSLEAALRGSRKVMVTFKRTSMVSLDNLNEMILGGMVELAPNQKLIFEMVRISGDWGGTDNNKFEIKLLPLFSITQFVNHFDGHIQAIGVVDGVCHE